MWCTQEWHVSAKPVAQQFVAGACEQLQSRRGSSTLREVKVLSLVLAIAACGGQPTKSTSTPATATAPATEPRELPDYPGVLEAGVTGGRDPTHMQISTDPVATVRAFFTKEHLQGFEILGGDATQESPLKVRELVSGREYAIAVYEQSSVTMIAATTHAY